MVKGPEFEARLYSESGSGTYFSGKGDSDAEAIGALVCRCPEQFNAEIEVVTNHDAPDQDEMMVL